MQNLNTNKQVAVLMATYNPNFDFLIKQINSIKEQTYTSWHCYIIDDCSENSNFEKIKNIVEQDNRFSITRNRCNLGSYHTFEEGLKLIANSEHEYICFCDQDDIWLPRKIEILVKEFDDLQISCVHSDLKLIDVNDDLIHPSCWSFERRNTKIYDQELLILRNTITGCSMMFRKEVLEFALPFPEQKNKISFHHDLWIALMSLVNGSIKAVNESLVLYRQHGNNVVGARVPSSRRFLKNFFVCPNKIEFLKNLYYSNKNLIDSLSIFFNERLTVCNEDKTKAKKIQPVHLEKFEDLVRLFTVNIAKDYRANQLLLVLLVGKSVENIHSFITMSKK